jgi:hypothetical protein
VLAAVGYNFRLLLRWLRLLLFRILTATLPHLSSDSAEMDVLHGRLTRAGPDGFESGDSHRPRMGRVLACDSVCGGAPCPYLIRRICGNG